MKRCLAAAIIALTAATAWGQTSRPVKTIVEQAKRATAFVEDSGNGSGTAFCIDPSGVFVTCFNSVQGKLLSPDKQKIILTLNAGEADETRLEATILRYSLERDLAFIKVQTDKPVAVLTLGPAEAPAEKSEVMVFGFPYGRLTQEKNATPSITVSAGKVASLQKNHERLVGIQLDTSLKPGNSGSPVLNERGEVIGVVASSIPGRGANFAVPVSHLREYMARPDMEFTPPTVTDDNKRTPTEFAVKVKSMLPPSPEYTVKLTLQWERFVRTIEMKPSGGAYRTTTAPVSGGTDEQEVLVSASFPDGTLRANAIDTVLSARGKTFKLSEVQSLQTTRGKTQLVLVGGQVLDEIPPDLKALKVKLGSNSLTMDLSEATVQFTALRKARYLNYQIAVEDKGVVVGQTNGSFIFQPTSSRPAASQPATASGPAAK